VEIRNQVHPRVDKRSQTPSKTSDQTPIRLPTAAHRLSESMFTLLQAFCVSGQGRLDPLSSSDALPNVRVVDVTVRVALVRSGLSSELVIEGCQGEAWLDEHVLTLLTETFDTWDLRVRLVEHLEP